MKFEDVVSASKRLVGNAVKTPVLCSSYADEITGARLYFKCENLQKTGSFKFRGAFNALSQFSDTQKKQGVVTYSSGNHAQAVALSARILGIPSTIVMPQDAPTSKMESTKRYQEGQEGSTVITYDRYKEDREAIAQKLQEEKGMTLIPPYNHPDIMAGQGTSALELLEEVGELDMLFVCLGGGGLLSGCSTVCKSLYPKMEVIGVEPEAGNDIQMSLKKGEIIHIDTPDTIADGAQTQHAGTLTFPVIQKNVKEVLTVTDKQLVEGMAFYYKHLKLVVEPTGCLSVAAAFNLPPHLNIKGKRVGIIVSGGNVDLKRYLSLLENQ